MKGFGTFALLFAVGTTQAFVPAVPTSHGSATALYSSTAEATTSMNHAAVRKLVSNLDASNFSDTLSQIEPYLLNEAGITFYTKTIRRIGAQAKTLGVEVPEKYAFEAKATQKRREKQDAFIQVKIEEAAAAAAEAAEAESEEAADGEAAE